MKLDTTQKVEKIFEIENSILLAQFNKSGIDPKIIEKEGASGTFGRHLHNNLGRIFGKDLSYLEIGTQRGLSFCTALINNEYSYACVIDNWCQGEFRKEFNENVEQFLKDKKFDLYDQDCWAIDLKEQIKQKINFYFYDGCHEQPSHEKAFTYYNEALDDTFLCMIDDWNCERVRAGTRGAFAKLNYKILHERSLFTENYDSRMGWGVGDPRTWWNGLFVALIEKN
jgi:hypothetical protein